MAELITRRDGAVATVLFSNLPKMNAVTYDMWRAVPETFAALDADPGVAFVSHWLQTFGDEHWTWTPRRCDLPSLLARNAVNGAAIVRRAAFAAVGGFDERMRHGCEDWDFWLRLVEAGFRGTIVPEVLYYYRRTAESMSRVMTSTDAYRQPLQVLVDKHEAAFRALDLI